MTVNNDGKKDDIDNKGTNAPGTDPKKNEKEQVNTGLDLSKVGDEDFNKVFEDPRLFKHDRFKNLLERAKAGDKAIEDAKKIEDQKLIDQKKFEELAEKRRLEAESFKTKYLNTVTDNYIRDAALKAGVPIGNVGALLKLVDRSNVKILDDGTAQGVDDAIKATLEAYPVFKTAASGTAPKIGSGSNPGGAGVGQPPRFKLSQIQDSKFYREHEKEIQEAYKLGAIEDDTK